MEWEDHAPEIAESFGGTMPHPDTNEQIKAAYLRAPSSVLRQADRVAAEYREGTARLPWGLLRHRVQNIQADVQGAAKTVTRDKAIERAEQWLRSAGLHYDRETEIEDELYGERGMLRQHPDTHDRMLELWRELAPLGAQTQHEAEQRGLAHQHQRAQGAT